MLTTISLDSDLLFSEYSIGQCPTADDAAQGLTGPRISPTGSVGRHFKPLGERGYEGKSKRPEREILGMVGTFSYIPS